ERVQTVGPVDGDYGRGSDGRGHRPGRPQHRLDELHAMEHGALLVVGNRARRLEEEPAILGGRYRLKVKTTVKLIRLGDLHLGHAHPGEACDYLEPASPERRSHGVELIVVAQHDQTVVERAGAATLGGGPVQ